jgi:hypothetical protein
MAKFNVLSEWQRVQIQLFLSYLPKFFRQKKIGRNQIAENQKVEKKLKTPFY